jgi:spore coat polysaccharide biosynthesis protein SpsF (cytidylyltransferase family)
MKNEIGIILQARAGSSRLPKKMILPFDGEKGILETILIRLKKSHISVPVIVATTTNPLDDSIEEIVLDNNLEVFRGSENHVLNRFIRAAEHYRFRKIIRICADNPFLDMEALAWQIKCFKNSNVDYWCYSLRNRIPSIKTHYGFWTEGVKLSTLKVIASKTDEKIYQEHVTNYIYTHPNSFDIHYEEINQEIENEKHVRLTIDTAEDYLLAKKVFAELKQRGIPFTAERIVSYINEKPSFKEIMKNEIIKNDK